MKLAWDAYAGEEFVHDADFAAAGFIERPLNLVQLSEWLIRWEAVVAWVQGRYEIGRTSLCHRSLLTAPFVKRAQEAIHTMRGQCETYSVAAVCLEEELAKRFRGDASPLGIFTCEVLSRELEAVSYDGESRVQRIDRTQDRRTTELLEAFRAKSGFGVLCHSGLNPAGRGSINCASDLLTFAKQTGIGVIVIDGRLYVDQRKCADWA